MPIPNAASDVATAHKSRGLRQRHQDADRCPCGYSSARQILCAAGFDDQKADQDVKQPAREEADAGQPLNSAFGGDVAGSARSAISFIAVKRERRNSPQLDRALCCAAAAWLATIRSLTSTLNSTMRPVRRQLATWINQKVGVSKVE